MALCLNRKCRTLFSTLSAPIPPPKSRGFRSDSALEAISKAREEKIPNLVLYNYPSFSGALSAMFAHIFHSRLALPCLILPFSSVEPLRVEDLRMEAVEKCYLLDFIGPPGFAARLSRQSLCEVIGFDHRKSAQSRIQRDEDSPDKVTLYVDCEKSSSRAAGDNGDLIETVMRFLDQNKGQGGVGGPLFDNEEGDRIEMVLKYMEDVDIRRWSLPGIRAFNIGLSEWRSKINCITNPHMFEQLAEISSVELIAKGNSYISARQTSARKLLDKVFKVRLGGGFYGECLGVRADGNTHLSDEIGKQLSLKSEAVGLRPIGAVVYMQRNNLKMCLRSTDSATDTSEVAKAYGGGGSPSSSSFIIRMDDYNQWL
ncbi:hypothetical protein Tsubulata_002918, partial [Turnera subulata]